MQFRLCAPRHALLFSALALVLCVSAAPAEAKFKVLYSFAGGSDGANPQAGLIRDKAANLYGTTLGGGAHGSGTVFAVARGGAETVLYPFQGGSDGAIPGASLMEDKAGNLYSTTFTGGAFDGGTVFKLAPDGMESVLYAFHFGSDGGNPVANLIADESGNLLSTTLSGGRGSGTVFALAPDGAETVLHTFKGARRDGAGPHAGVVMDGSGNLYGTTEYGTSAPDGHDNGTVFKIAASGDETVVHNFLGKDKNDGAHPYAGVILDDSGNLYGTTRNGGADCDCGTVFRLDPGGAETLLHVFTGGSDGSQPVAGLIADDSGNLYGTTSAGGAHGFGTVFRLAPDGTETVLHAFKGGGDGANPAAGLIADKRGNLYGTTYGGGTKGLGTVFRLNQ